MYRFFNSLLGTECVCTFTTEYLDLIDCNYTTELYAALRHTYEYVFAYTCHVFLPLLSCVLRYCCCCCSCCCFMLLLFVIVCRRAKTVAVVHYICSQCFIFIIQTRYAFTVRTAWQHCRIRSLDLPIIRTLDPRELRACAEKRWTSTRRGGAPLTLSLLFARGMYFVGATGTIR